MSLLQTLDAAGVKLGYSPELLTVPQIPTVEDVIFALDIHDSTQSSSHDFPWRNIAHSTYVTNCYLVAAVVAKELIDMWPFDKNEARRIIAETIVKLSPTEAINDTNYLEAQRIA